LLHISDLNSGVSVVTISDASVQEGDSQEKTMTFNVSITPPSEDKVQIEAILLPDTGHNVATANDDYTPPDQSLRIDFPPKSSSPQHIAISIKGDIVPEENETIRVQLKNLTSVKGNVILGRAIGIGTIVDDDHVLVEVSPCSDSEDHKHKLFSVSVTPPSKERITLFYSLSVKDQETNKAIAGQDFTPITTPLALTFEPEKANRSITVEADGRLDGDGQEKSFYLVLQDLAGKAAFRGAKDVLEQQCKFKKIAPR
jgi:hypothetical protein